MLKAALSLRLCPRTHGPYCRPWSSRFTLRGYVPSSVDATYNFRVNGWVCWQAVGSADRRFGSRWLREDFYRGVGLFAPHRKKWQTTERINCQKWQTEQRLGDCDFLWRTIIEQKLWVIVTSCEGHLTSFNLILRGLPMEADTHKHKHISIHTYTCNTYTHTTYTYNIHNCEVP